MAVFLLGWAINLHSDTILANLRKPGEAKTYKVPRGACGSIVGACTARALTLERLALSRSRTAERSTW